MVVVVKPLLLSMLAVVATSETKTLSSVTSDGAFCSEVTLESAATAQEFTEHLKREALATSEEPCASLDYLLAAGSQPMTIGSGDNSHTVTVDLYTKLSSTSSSSPPTPGGQDEGNQLLLESTNSKQHQASTAPVDPRNNHGGAGGTPSHTWVDSVTVSWMGPNTCYETTYIKTDWEVLTKMFKKQSTWEKSFLLTCEQRKYRHYHSEWLEPSSALKRFITVKKYLLDQRYWNKQTRTNTGPDTTPARIKTTTGAAY